MNEKILVADDSTTTVEMIKTALEQERFQVITAYNGEEALDKAHKENPDLIILDLMLPKMDGYKICAMLKRNQKYMKIPIIMFTARAQESDEKLGFEVGADAYITKPFEPAVLLDKIKELLGK